MQPQDRRPPQPGPARPPLPPVPAQQQGPPYPRQHPQHAPHPRPVEPPPVQQRRPRSAGAAIATLGAWSLLAPVAVLLLGMLAYAGIVVATFALLVFTFGMIAADPQGEAWINDRLGAGDYDTWMGHVTPVAWASLFVTLALGGLVLALIRRTGAVAWHPLLQGTLSATAAVVLLVGGTGLVGLVA